jgi:hypothetical protein
MSGGSRVFQKEPQAGARGGKGSLKDGAALRDGTSQYTSSLSWRTWGDLLIENPLLALLRYRIPLYVSKEHADADRQSVGV